MSKKVDPPVTQSYLHSALKEELGAYVTKSYFNTALKKELEPYVTKSYLDKKLEKYVTKEHFDTTLDERFSEMEERFERQTGIILENTQEMITKVFEGLEMKIDSLRRDVQSRDIWMSNHEDRITKLELQS